MEMVSPKGYIEVLGYPVISIDDCQIKNLEAILGTGEAFVRAFQELTGEDISDKEFLVIGYGKVGQGIAKALKKYTINKSLKLMKYSKPQFTTAEIDRLTLAYERTVYEVYDRQSKIQIYIGKYNSQLNQLLINYHCYNWAIVTAVNPYSQCLISSENLQRQQKLRDYLQTRKFTTFAAAGADPTGVWSPEPSLLILGIDRAEAITIGTLFEQNAIVWGIRDAVPELLWI